MSRRRSVSTLGVVGAGAWGTALANAAARAGLKVVLWARDERHVAELVSERVNRRYLPGVTLHDAIVPSSDLAAVAETDALLLVVPAQALRGVVAELAVHLAPGAPLVSCAKGIERGSLAFTTGIIAEAAPAARPAVLSGPSFARDVAAGLPTAVTLAAHDAGLARRLALALASPAFRLYHSSDVAGVEVGGAAKNVLAIAAGIAAGRGLGASAGAALIARGFTELRRLGRALGARPDTLMGLSGLGDLVLTATTPQSRNFAFGHAIGAGEAPPDRLAEGVFTAEALVALAKRYGVDMPIARAVDEVLSRALSVDEAMDTLLARPLKAEADPTGID
jgi:glycerol-3-phosphate dehydrogenase (NAD(P)+)